MKEILEMKRTHERQVKKRQMMMNGKNLFNKKPAVF